MASWPKTEQEEKVESLLSEVERTFRKIEKTKKPEKLHVMIKDVTNKLKDAKILIREFEREARADGMPAPELADRKRTLADLVNQFIEMRKSVGVNTADRGDLFENAQAAAEDDHDGMTTQQLIYKGKRQMKDTEEALDRAERIVEDTRDIGKNVAAAMGDQTRQLNKIVDDLNEIEFTMKKASKVITDITRGLLTDKCIGFLIFLVVAGIIVVVVLKIVKPFKKNIASTCDTSLNGTNAISDTLTNALCGAVDTVNNAVNNAVNSTSNAVSNAVGRKLLAHSLHAAKVVLQADGEHHQHEGLVGMGREEEWDLD